MSREDSRGSHFDEGPHPPRDEELRRTIERVAEFVAKYGPESEDKAQRDNRGNPKFDFLFGGPYNDYYKFLVHMYINAQRGGEGAAPSLAPQMSNEEEQIRGQISQLRQQISDSERNLKAQLESQPAMKEAQLAQQIIAAEEQKIAGYLNNVKLDITNFVDILNQLNSPKCSKDAISNSKKWIFDNSTTDQQREVILTYILSRVKDSQSSDCFRLNILYLINDWAHHCQRKKLEPITQMLSRYVPQMYAFTIEGASDMSLQQKLDKLTGVWEGHKYFNDQCFKQLRNPSHIYTTTKSAQAAEYAKLGANIEVQLQAMYAGYEQQHNNYVQHVMQQIAQLESRLPEFQQHQPPMPGPGGPAPMRRSRFDQQSRFDEAPPQQPGSFGRFFTPPVQAPPKQGWMEEEGYNEGSETAAAPDGDDIDGHPFNEDDLVPKAPYFELPAGVMVPLVTFENLTYNGIEPSAIRLPPPVPPSQRLHEAMEAFYSPLDRPRDAAGWERDGLAEFFDRKMRLKKILEEKLQSEGKTLEQIITNKMSEEDVRLLKEDREAAIAKELAEKKNGGRARSRSRSRSSSGSRSRSRSRTRRRGSRSSSSSSGSSSSSSSGSSRSRSPRRNRRSRSRSRSGSPPRRGLSRRSPTPPSFGGPSFASPAVPLGTENKGALLMQKMGWSGKGLGAQESGIVEPINPGEVRDKTGQFRGLGSKLDPFEEYRKNRSTGYHDRNQSVFAARERSSRQD